MTRQALVLVNPLSLARHGLRPAELEALFVRAGILAEVMPLPLGAALEPVRDRLQQSPPALVVAAGGDGTINEVLNMLVLGRSTLGVLPLGTANDFARTLALPLDLEGAIARLAEGQERRIDVGEVDGYRFLNAAHLGLGVETARLTIPALKRLAGPVAYLVAAAMAWRRARPIELAIETPERQWTMPAVQLLVGHGRFFGGGFQIAPEATLDDGLFDVHVLDWPLSFFEAFSWALSLKRGTLRKARGSVHFRTDRLDVRLSRPVELNLDGELLALGETLAFRLHRQALTVRA